MQEMGLSKDGGVAPSHAHQIWCYPYSHKLQALGSHLHMRVLSENRLPPDLMVDYPFTY